MKRVLFVDDEAQILEGLRVRLRRETDWEMVCVDSGARAIGELEQNAFDVIVTDMRMPRMDGGQLLQTVSTRWPETVRIVLSGFAEFQQAVNLAPVAHQFLSKPCDAQQLKNRIERCLHLHEFLRKPELRTIVGRIRKLPALPRTYSRLKALMARDETSVGEVAEILAKDPAIAAKVLQMVNSAFFRLARRITNIEQAVGYLGFAAIRNLVLSVEVFSQWAAPQGHRGPDLERLQEHVQRVTIAARAVAANTVFADDVLLAALLHDIGYWVLAQECPNEFQTALALARQQRIPLHEAERRVIGAAHSELGAYLLGLWGLPYSVIEAVAHHHEPDRVQHPEFDAMAALAIAHSLADISEESVFGLEPTATPEADAATNSLRSLPLPFPWAEVERRVTDSFKSGDSQT